MLLTIAPVIMFFLAFLGLITSRNIIKSILCLMIKESSIIVFFLSIGFHRGIAPPIGTDLVERMDSVADPVPQALMITAIVIGLVVTAVDITMVMYLARKTNSTDWLEVHARSPEIEE
jgi:multicomponent Na+:H+ antiporter subunit C